MMNAITIAMRVRLVALNTKHASEGPWDCLNLRLNPGLLTAVLSNGSQLYFVYPRGVSYAVLAEPVVSLESSTL